MTPARWFKGAAQVANATGILGGSFNPLHVGHLRIALEAQEALKLSRVLLIPCASPPHKPGLDLLPFDLRLTMLTSAVAGLPGFEVCPLEAERPGPSYTVDTLLELRRRRPGEPLVFIMGAGDFLTLERWRRYDELPGLADFAVLPRDGAEAESFRQKARELWPGVCLAPPVAGAAETYTLPGGGRLLYIPQPRLDISSTLVRQRFITGRNIDFLVPPAVAALLQEHKDQVSALWAGGTR